MPFPLGAALGAGATIISGLLGKSSQESADEKNYQAQKEFAQNSVQWKVKDASKAGVHPLYALGAQTTSFSPSYAGDSSLAGSLAQAGQDIGGAIDRTRTAPQKLDAVARTAQALELERAGLQNDLLRTQIAEAKARTAGPAFPSAVDPYILPGQGDSGVKTQALEVNATRKGSPHMEAGPVADIGFSRTESGGLAPVYSSDVKERLEDDWGGMLAWNLRNRILPNLGFSHKLPPPPQGSAWSWNPLTQSYEPVELGGAF